MAMIRKLNPVLIGGFDTLYLGRKGFSSLARANRALVRPKGARKDEPWVEISFKNIKKKADKDKKLTLTLMKMSKSRDVEAEKAVRKAKKKAARVPRADKIKFKLEDVSDKLIRSHDGQYLNTRKYFYHTPRAIEFVEGRDMSLNVINTYIQAVKKKFLGEVYPKYGKSSYLIRFYHDYENLESNQINDPLERGFSGLGLNRQVMDKADAKEQFDILSEIYLESFGKYLQFARSNTYVRFTGFTVEVALNVRPDPKGIGFVSVRNKPKRKKKRTKAQQDEHRR